MSFWVNHQPPSTEIEAARAEPGIEITEAQKQAAVEVIKRALAKPDYLSVEAAREAEKLGRGLDSVSVKTSAQGYLDYMQKKLVKNDKLTVLDLTHLVNIIDAVAEKLGVSFGKEVTA